MAECELVLLEGRIVLWLEDLAVMLLLLPPATLANCSGVSSFFGSLIVTCLSIFLLIAGLNVVLVSAMRGL